jgi:heptosyltransferase II
MENILVIKTGAAGDVVRTTSLLNVLAGNIYWVTSPVCQLLLPEDMPHLTSLTLEEAFVSLTNIPFALVISLEEDRDCARLAGEVQSRELAGVYIDKGKICYTDNSSAWFDMSMVSRFGLERANKLKASNELTYQDCIFSMIGKKFNGEPYRIYSDGDFQPGSTLIGIEKRTGERWPDKQWWGYDGLIKELEQDNIPIKIFKHRNNIREYLKDISACSHIVSGDSLAMHIAMAYQKTCSAIFNCTSPREIYDYGLLTKVVSPLLNKYFYSSSFDKEVIESVPVEEVYKTLRV